MLGLYNLGRHDIGIELRVVITRMNYRRLPKLPDFIYRNLPFVEFISLMGLEYTGYTIKNREAVWIDPMDYQAELAQAVLELRDGTVLRRDVWEGREVLSLKGLFLDGLWKRYEAAGTDAERANIELAARYGLAALEGSEEPPLA